MTVQTVNLDNEYTVQYVASVVSILQIEDIPEERILRVIVQLGDKREYRYTIDVFTTETYIPEWTHEAVVNSIKNYFINNQQSVT